MGLSLLFFTFMLLVFLLSFPHVALASFPSMQPLCHDNERHALLQFRGSFIVNSIFCWESSDYPKVALWKAEEENSDCCSWDGVTCDEETGHVIRLDLANSCLYGSINSSSSLFRLVHLEWLSLAYNFFDYSQIPSKFMNLRMLSHLNLSRSMISGQIPPEILELSKLETLDLSNNGYLMLQNPSLKSLAEKLTNLKMLNLNLVNIPSSIPRILANLTSLTYLSLEECSLQGEFPREIFQLPNLYHLSVSGNYALDGYLQEFDESSSLEESMGNLKSLSYLDISGCNFRGIIPSSIGNFTQINYLDLSNTEFSSQIPSSFGNLTQLRHLALSSFMFPGELPAFMGNLQSLKELDISYCNLSGQTPSSVLSNLTQLNLLDLSFNNFSSQNPLLFSSISKLTKLTELKLHHINFSGVIPSSFKNLTQLTSLDMSFNQLTSPLPHWLMNLSQLRDLDLSSNQLTGGIPTRVHNLTQLESLKLSSNQFQGSIPSSIFELERLNSLDLSSNNLSGTVELDIFLGKPKDSFALDLSFNNLSLVTKEAANRISRRFFASIRLNSCNLSEFPSFLSNQDNLCAVDLSSNHIEGEIPGWLLNVRHGYLVYLNLSHNLLTGFDKQVDPPSWRGLHTLDLRHNKLQGSLPFPSKSAFHYLLSNNNLTGIIPSWICELDSLQLLDLSNNRLSGTLPQCLGNFSEVLTMLDLRNNKFHGSLPQTFVVGTKLKMIDLSRNLLEGRIPRSLANCTRLEFLNLGDNQIMDTFPSWLGGLPELQVLVLQSNKFYGVIKAPETDFEFPKLRIIDLSQNRFTGKFPSKYFQCWNAMKAVNTSELTYMRDVLVPEIIYEDFGVYAYSLTLSCKGQRLQYEKVSNMVVGILLSNNEFTGEIPVSIGDLKGLKSLNLSNNHLSGQIPSSLGNLKALESFDLSNNMFSGKIPQELAELTSLAYFNVSHNHLTGSIPQGTQFDTFPYSSFEGNPGLCGKYVSKECIVDAPKKEVQGFHKSTFQFDLKIVLIGYAGGTIAGVAFGHVFVTTGKHEWFLMNFERLLKRIKRRGEHRN